uniref:Major facilitator superfamily (MFS) profile domain-containing protein n=1 Tax=Fibrocapsa japonica TaxID=94617 RepID=A0A7S2UVJ4_9STRA
MTVDTKAKRADGTQDSASLKGAYQAVLEGQVDPLSDAQQLAAAMGAGGGLLQRGGPRPGRLLLTSWLGAAFVYGIVVIGMESNLSDLALRAYTTDDQMSMAMVWRGIGSTLGAFCIAPVLLAMDAHTLLATTTGACAGLLLAMPWISTSRGFFAAFAGFGALLPVQDAALQFLVARHYGPQGAGPIQQAVSICMFLSILLCPALHYMLGFNTEYLLLGGFSLAAAVMAIALPSPGRGGAGSNEHPKGLQEAAGSAPGSGSPPQGGRQAIWAELREMDVAGNICTMLIIFLTTTAVVQTTSYIRTYAVDMALLSVDQDDLLLLCYLVPAVTGMFVAMPVQKLWVTSLDRACTLLAICMAVGAMSGLISAASGVQGDNTTQWLSTALYGFGTGPAIGLGYDVWNRAVQVTELSTALVMGVGFVAPSLATYLTFHLWQSLDSPEMLQASNAVYCFLALLCAVYLQQRGRGTPPTPREQKLGPALAKKLKDTLSKCTS